MSIIFSAHAAKRMIERNISEAEVASALTGVAVENYDSAKPYPAKLFFARVAGRPLHVVAAFDSATGDVFIITVYEPDLSAWMPDFVTRRKP